MLQHPRLVLLFLKAFNAGINVTQDQMSHKPDLTPLNSKPAEKALDDKSLLNSPNTLSDAQAIILVHI